jgi:hypothetical protein
MLEAGTMGRALFLRGAGIVLAAACLTYLGDTLIARYRVVTHKESALSSMSIYYSTTMKNNKVVIFGGAPDTITCIHALFPHFGYPTCRSLQSKTVNLD